MKLILAGAGVKEGDLSLRAYEEIKKADKVFIISIINRAIFIRLQKILQTSF